MNAPPGQPPGGRPPQGPGQMRFDPETGQPIQQQPQQPAPQQPAYQQPAQPAQPAYQQPAQPAQPVYQQPQQPAYQQPAQPAQPAPMQPAQQPGQPVYQQPMAAPPMVKKKDETLALVSVLLAAAAWVLQFHIFASVPAVICGHMARKKIKNDPEKYGGDGMAKAGVIIGWINIVLILLGIIAWVLVMAAGCIMALIGSA